MNKPASNHQRVLRVGEIVQINPATCCQPMFAGCMMVVDEVYEWGAQGYVQALGKDGQPGGRAYYRAAWTEMEITFGRVVFKASDELLPMKED